jgi:hypothetical protein
MKRRFEKRLAPQRRVHGEERFHEGRDLADKHRTFSGNPCTVSDEVHRYLQERPTDVITGRF